MKVYIAKTSWAYAPCDFMIYDHLTGSACWGEKFYYVDFKDIKKYWQFIGNYDS